MTRARVDSGSYVVALQRRPGLYLSSAKAANDDILEAGGVPDYLGDAACNTLATIRPSIPCRFGLATSL